jgi:hypothetical protein
MGALTLTRELIGRPDSILGYAQSFVVIDDPEVVAMSGELGSVPPLRHKFSNRHGSDISLWRPSALHRRRGTLKLELGSVPPLRHKFSNRHGSDISLWRPSALHRRRGTLEANDEIVS